MAANQDIGEAVEKKYNDTVKAVGGNLQQGFTAAASSSLGKGIAFTALLIAGVAAVLGGWMGAKHLLKISTTANPAGVLVQGFGEGAKAGLIQAYNFLTSAMGIGIVATGAGAKMVYDHHKGNTEAAKIETAVAHEKIRQLTHEKERAQEQQLASEKQAAGKNFTVAENDRRAKQSINQVTG